MCEFSGVNFPLQENITKPKSRQVSTWPKAFISMLWKKYISNIVYQNRKNALLCGVLRNEHDSMNSFCCFQNKLLHPDIYIFLETSWGKFHCNFLFFHLNPMCKFLRNLFMFFLCFFFAFFSINCLFRPKYDNRCSEYAIFLTVINLLHQIVNQKRTKIFL